MESFNAVRKAFLNPQFRLINCQDMKQTDPFTNSLSLSLCCLSLSLFSLSLLSLSLSLSLCCLSLSLSLLSAVSLSLSLLSAVSLSLSLSAVSLSFSLSLSLLSLSLRLLDVCHRRYSDKAELFKAQVREQLSYTLTNKHSMFIFIQYHDI